MFVTKDRFILKTCGTTTLLHCVDPLLRLVKSEVGYDSVQVRLLIYFKLLFCCDVSVWKVRKLAAHSFSFQILSQVFLWKERE